MDFSYLHILIVIQQMVDVFHFNNETDTLGLRLNVLDDSVGQFVIKEARQTFRGNHKPVLDFLPPKTRIERVAFTDGLTTWQRDSFQKNYRVGGISYDDIVMTSDVDEIPNMETVRRLIPECVNGASFRLMQRFFVGYLNVAVTNRVWFGTIICNGWTYNNCEDLVPMMIGDGGWHWSFLGGEHEIRRKLSSYSHEEYDVPGNHQLIAERLRSGEDPIDRGFITERVEIDDTFPVYIQNNQKMLRSKGLILA